MFVEVQLHNLAFLERPSHPMATASVSLSKKNGLAPVGHPSYAPLFLVSPDKLEHVTGGGRTLLRIPDF